MKYNKDRWKFEKRNKLRIKILRKFWIEFDKKIK